MKRVIVIITIILIIIGCQKKPNPVPANETSNFHYIGDTVNLKYGGCKEIVDSVDNRTYELCFFQDSIIDNRCPNPYCIQGPCGFTPFNGAKVKFEWKAKNGNTAIISLIAHPFSCGKDFTLCDSSTIYNVKDTLGYRFCLISLTPYPDSSNVPINQENYVAKIKIKRL